MLSVRRCIEVPSQHFHPACMGIPPIILFSSPCESRYLRAIELFVGHNQLENRLHLRMMAFQIFFCQIKIGTGDGNFFEWFIRSVFELCYRASAASFLQYLHTVAGHWGLPFSKLILYSGSFVTIMWYGIKQILGDEIYNIQCHSVYKQLTLISMVLKDHSIQVDALSLHCVSWSNDITTNKM